MEESSRWRRRRRTLKKDKEKKKENAKRMNKNSWYLIGHTTGVGPVTFTG
jgi:hypothetical protein